MTPRYDVTRRFEISVPDNGDNWKGDVSHLLRNSVQIYSEDSKLHEAIGNTVGIAQSIRLPDHCSVFQAVTIFSYSQAAIKTLSFNMTNSKTVYGYRRYLNKIAGRYDIHIVWVPCTQ